MKIKKKKLICKIKNEYMPLRNSVVLSSTRFNKGSYPFKIPEAVKYTTNNIIQI